MSADLDLLSSLTTALRGVSGADHSVQESALELLDEISPHPDFLSLLLAVIEHNLNGCAFHAAALMRSRLPHCAPDSVASIVPQVAPVILSVFQTAEVAVVRQVAALAAAFDPPIFDDTGSILIQLLQSRPIIALHAAFEFCQAGIDPGRDFAAALPQFVVSPFSTLALPIAALLSHSYAADFKDTILPIALEKADSLPGPAIQYVVSIISTVPVFEWGPELVDFLLNCVSFRDDNDAAAIRAAKLFRIPDLPFEPRLIPLLFDRIGDEPDLFVYSVSSVCWGTLASLFDRCPQEVLEVSMPLLEGEDVDTRRLLRVLSVLQRGCPNVSDVLATVCSHFEGEFVVEAVGCLVQLAMSWEDLRLECLSAAFPILEGLGGEVRIQFTKCLVELVGTVADLPLEPYLGILLSLFDGHLERAELLELLYLTGSVCRKIKEFENGEHLNGLLELAHSLFREDGIGFVGAIHIFSEILLKSAELAPEILQLVGPRVLESIHNQPEEVYLIGYLFRFVNNAAKSSIKFGIEVAEFLEQAFQAVPNYVEFRIPREIRSEVWRFVCQLVVYQHPLVGENLEFLVRTIVNTPDNECLEIIARIARMLEFLLEGIEGWDEEFVAQFGHILITGLEAEEDGAFAKMRIARCLTRVLCKFPGIPLEAEQLALAAQYVRMIEDDKERGPFLQILQAAWDQTQAAPA
jgi:hypothetical protein